MTQDAVVTKLISRHVAEVEVERGTACGGTCESCEACVFQNRIRAEGRQIVADEMQRIQSDPELQYLLQNK